MDAKLLTEAGWKTVVQKFKVKDNGLQRALSTYERLADDKYEDRLKGAAAVSQLAANLKRAKEVVTLPLVVKYLTDVVTAAETDRRQITNAKALAEKTRVKAAKAEAIATKKAEEAAKKEAELRQARVAPVGSKKISPKERQKIGKPLLLGIQRVQSGHGREFEWIATVRDSRSRTPVPGLLIAPKVGMPHKQILLKVTGIKRFVIGTCLIEEGKFTFVVKGGVAPETIVAQMRKSIQFFTGKSLPLRARRAGDKKVFEEDPEEAKKDVVDMPAPGEIEAGEIDPADLEGAEIVADEPETGGTEEPLLNATRPFEISASVGRGGRNLPEDVEAVQVALNRRAGAGLDPDGKCGSNTIAAIVNFQKALGQSKPDGLVQPGRGTARALAGSGKIGPPPAPPKPIAPPKLGVPTLSKAPEVWHGTRGILDTNIKELKKAIRQEYADEHPDILTAIDKSVTKLDSILEKLDTRLADSLAKAHASTDPAARRKELQNARTILESYINYVKSEPMIAHIDSNPFGVDTKLEKVIADSLDHMAKSMRA